jgi:tetratricopeptide (TPR) repeat protein
MFARRAPFQARNKVEYIAANIQSRAPMLDTMAPVSHEVAQLVDAMLRKDPKHRPETEALRRDLGRLAARDEGAVVVRDDPTSIFATDDAHDPVPQDGAPLPLIGGAIGVAVLALILWAFSSPTPPAVTPPEDPPVVKVPLVNVPVVKVPVVPVKESDVKKPSDALHPIRTAGLQFDDQLAKIEFGKQLARGDEAWKKKDAKGALAGWSKALDLVLARPAALRTRVLTARRVVALADGSAAEERGDFAKALRIYDAAVLAGVKDEDIRARAERLRVLVERERELRRKLRRAETLGNREESRDQAVELLLGLRATAKALGKESVVEEMLARLKAAGAKPPPPSPENDTPPAQNAPPPSDDERLLEKAEDLLSQGLLDVAEMALRQAERRSGETLRTKILQTRITRRRQTPKGMLYLEHSADPAKLPAGLYASEKLVTNERFAPWFAAAISERSLVPPTSWAGNTRPRMGSEDEVVKGVRASIAEKYAASVGARLATAAELDLMERALGRPVERPQDGIYPDGFRVFEDLR